jgi:type III secretory pathway component EscT
MIHFVRLLGEMVLDYRQMQYFWCQRRLGMARFAIVILILPLLAAELTRRLG